MKKTFPPPTCVGVGRLTGDKTSLPYASATGRSATQLAEDVGCLIILARFGEIAFGNLSYPQMLGAIFSY